jgi:hypothetical protein
MWALSSVEHRLPVHRDSELRRTDDEVSEDRVGHDAYLLGRVTGDRRDTCAVLN